MPIEVCKYLASACARWSDARADYFVPWLEEVEVEYEAPLSVRRRW